MKKRLLSWNNQSGFVLPTILFMLSIITLGLMTTIILYERNIFATQFYLDQLQIETMMQMAHTSFTNTYSVESWSTIQDVFHFPTGHVKVTYNRWDDILYTLHYEIVTDTTESFTIVSHHEHKINEN